MSMRARATALAADNPELARGDLITLFVNTLGMNPGTANSYASSVRTAPSASAAAVAPILAMPDERANETDEEIRKRLDERFDAIEMMAGASCSGDIRALIISGPAGLGKSHTTEMALKGLRSGRYQLRHCEGIHQGNRPLPAATRVSARRQRHRL